MAAFLGITPAEIGAVGAHFAVDGEFQTAAPCGSGHINDTYAATYTNGGQTLRYVHQRINHAIFKDPAAMMDNIVRVTRHLQARLDGDAGAETARQCLALIPTRTGGTYHLDTQGCYWRTYRMIEGARSLDTLSSPDQAREAARAFGLFQRGVADLGGIRLHETIPAFHHTPLRYENFVQACQRDIRGRAAAAKKEIAFAEKREALTRVLLDPHERGLMPERITHNDTKINNVLFDEATGRALCVIDLDTVMPGLSLYDFGDLVRTATSAAEEDERDLSLVRLRLPFFEALVEGYLEAAGSTLTPAERALLPEAGMLITFETGLRFLTDHLSGDTYFRIHRPDHNLDRCRTQFALVAELEKNLGALRAIVDRCATKVR